MSRRLDLRRLRLKAVWLLIIPFYIFSAPSTNLLWWGAGMSAAGLSLRAWAAGSIRKDRELATTGPYAHTRNPLYLGSFLLGAGVTIAGGQWVFGVAFFALFLLVYRATALREATELEVRFGEGYRPTQRRCPRCCRGSPGTRPRAQTRRGEVFREPATSGIANGRRRSDQSRPSVYWL